MNRIGSWKRGSATSPFPIDLDVIAGAAGTSVSIIKELNPELRTWCTPLESPTYLVRIPKGSAELFLGNLALIPEDQRFTLKPYQIKRGDTLALIANKANVPLGVLKALNGLGKRKAVEPGRVIYLPPQDKIKLCSDIVKSQKDSPKKRRRNVVT